ncbi:chemokine-like receptor 1 [Microcaecilia unicolor]|uniref:Chemokine-like receptor 1 n=1 Tax=Microcaecilia unicolor TaxID=1415580 RepID=A0A6P7YXF2_9AMPH|nr:chemokine-like receptor 1 [Microcaecilia unicolor]
MVEVFVSPVFLNVTSAQDRETSTEEPVSILGATINAFIFVAGTTGNGLVIWLMAFRTKKNVLSTWILNLAVADFVFSAFRILAAVRDALGDQWPFGLALCKLSVFVKHVNLYTSVFILAIISIDRCLLVTSPVWSRNHRTARLSSTISFASWCLAAILSMPHMLFRGTSLKGTRIKCTFEGTEDHIKLVLYLIRFTFSFFIPFMVITTCYLAIAVKIKKRQRTHSRRFFQIISVIILTFFLSWFPYHIVSLLKFTQVSRSSLKVAYSLAAGLAYLNSCINPLLYCFMGYLTKQSLSSLLRNVLSDGQ